MLTWNTSEPERVVKQLLDACAAFRRVSDSLGNTAPVDPSLCLRVDPKTGWSSWISRDEVTR